MYRRDVLGIAAVSAARALGARVGDARTDGRSPASRQATAGQGAADEGAGTTSDGSAFAPIASLPIDGAREAVVGPGGTTVFLAVEDGFAVVDVSDPAEPRLLAERRGLLPDAEGGPMTEVQDVSVEGDRLLVMGPAHAGIEGPKAALLYDVSDPADPRRLAIHRTDYPIHNGTLAGGRAYLTANEGETDRLVIVAMEGEAGDGGDTRVLGRWSVVDADGTWADVPSRIRPVHDVIVHRGIAYCSYWDAGTWLVDVRDPTAPRALDRIGRRSASALTSVEEPGREATELPGNHHSAAIDASGDVLAVGHEAWDADGDGDGGPGGIDLVDVSTPGAPAVRSTIEPPPTDDPSRRGGVWTTAHNFELRDGRLYSAWYQGGVRVHDVTDLREPREIAAWRDSDAARFWTAQVAAEAVVASSMGTEEAPARLYTFPDPAPPATTTTAGPVTATPGMAGVGAGLALAGAGIGWFLSRRRGE